MAAKITCRSRAKDLLEEIDLPRVILEAHPVGGDRIVLGLLRLPRFDMTIRVYPITLRENDHNGHLEGFLGYPGPLTLPQNSIGSLRGDVRPEL
ncbi:hypothetical protein CDL15_Pgr018952 [Punica granatum]|uniref:Uncharacterized protein n=1 Tax=Punica granatum TaxID=22663 RepID=A0A218WPG8_PUNGR|nr:hypothetical protein CDL15_Pgr018952 [Punica granatum]